MKRTSLKLAALLVLACLALTACAGSPSAQTAATSAAAQATGAPAASTAPDAASEPVTPRGQFPIVTDDLTLDIAMVVTATVEDINTNYATTWLEETSGINLEFTQLPADETATKINLMLASGETSDVFAGYNMSKAAIEEYAAAGWIVPLDDYIAAYGDGYDELMADLGDLSDMFLNYVTLSDGKRYSLNYVSTVSTNMYYGNCWMYMPWLGKLGYDKAPGTLDEFFDYCMAIKTGDPNGNGKADEMPISGSSDYFPRVIAFIGNAFQYTDFTWYCKVDGRQVSFMAGNDQYKATVEYLKKLYDNGLIDGNHLTQSKSDMKAIFAQDDLTVGVLFTNSPSGYMDTTVEPCLSFRIVEPFSQNGFATTTSRGMSVYHDWIISSSCENPAAAYRLGDLILSSYGSDVVRYGEEGVDWSYAKEGEKDIVGNQAYMTLINDVWGLSSQNKIWRTNALPYHIKQTYLERTSNGDDTEYEAKKYIGTNAYAKYACAEYLPETMIFASADDEARISILKNDIVTYVQEQTAAFMTGARSMDTWDAYVDELKMLGVDEYVSILQAGYDELTK
jgi:putative aldouronate transport system substrate-binding protein